VLPPLTEKRGNGFLSVIPTIIFCEDTISLKDESQQGLYWILIKIFQTKHYVLS